MLGRSLEHPRQCCPPHKSVCVVEGRGLGGGTSVTEAREPRSPQWLMPSPQELLYHERGWSPTKTSGELLLATRQTDIARLPQKLTLRKLPSFCTFLIGTDTQERPGSGARSHTQFFPGSSSLIILFL